MTAQVFVYGTLKRGGTNHHHLAGQRWVGEACTAPAYRLFLLEGYPGLVDAESAGEGLSIEGELWEVSAECLARLDEFEGVPEGLYRRGSVRLLAPHERVAAETYFYARSVEGRTDIGNRF